ncbi:uncharacterized protein BKA78DRAFT_72378 [Phyllosticta capitalensis]|uniref:uncharacterized protein n=1 Tax=Phyllosticta capitalensis TaxID=121624 RepID=UPI00312F9CB6
MFGVVKTKLCRDGHSLRLPEPRPTGRPGTHKPTASTHHHRNIHFIRQTLYMQSVPSKETPVIFAFECRSKCSTIKPYLGANLREGLSSQAASKWGFSCRCQPHERHPSTALIAASAAAVGSSLRGETLNCVGIAVLKKSGYASREKHELT